MNLQQLRYLVAVAEEKHFGRAADRCFVSQPTLSTQLKKLEDDLGLVFFERTNKSVEITAVGMAALEHARQALDEVAAIEALSLSAQAPLCGALRIGIIPTLCPYLLPWLLPRLAREHPQLDFQVTEDLTHNVSEMLLDHHLDCVLIAVPESLPATVEVALFDEPFWVACPANHPLARAEAISLKNLKDETLFYVSEGHCLREQTIAACGARGRHDAARVDAFKGASLESLRRMVAAGLGFTLLPVLAMLERCVESDVVCRPFAGQASRRIGLVYRQTYPRPKDMQLLAQCIVDALPVSVMPVL